MKPYSLSHLEDHVLRRDLTAAASQEFGASTWLLAHIAEFDARKLYAREAYSSMHLYCVRQLGMSEDVAYKSIRAARAAREFPAIFPALADGRLRLSAVLLLKPHLTQKNAGELLAAAAHKTRAEIELLLAERFPKSDVPTLMQAIEPAGELAPGPVEEHGVQLVPERAASPTFQLAPGPVASSATPRRVDRAKLTPLSPGRCALQVTVKQETCDKLRYAQSLLGHAVPSGDVDTVLDRALGLLIQHLEQSKFAPSARSRPNRSSGNGRYIPAAIRSAIWDRDGGQCTFVSESGRRCEERTRLEFDHIDPVGRGGQTSVDRLRLLCRTHNQYAAERTYGAGFMREKREQARRAAEARKRVRSEAAAAPTAATATSQPDVLSCLRKLGFTSEEAHRGAALCADIPDSPLEKRVVVALAGLAPPCARRESHAGASAVGGAS